MMRLFQLLALIGVLAGTAAAQTPSARLAYEDAPTQVSLVNGLREISGLALASANSVYAHNDEHGIVYELSLSDGAVRAAFAFGDPTVSADFEGIAVNDGRIYLVTSTGLIYEGLIGAHRSRVRYNIYDTGVGALCEVEGLVGVASPGEFLILCKRPSVIDYQGRLVVFRWDLKNRRPVDTPWINIPYRNFLTPNAAEIFRPSAIEWDEANKSLVIVSARSRQLVVLSQDGELIYRKPLSEKLHAQAEGVVITPAGDLIVADEGAGRGPGKLSIYQPAR